MQLNIKLETVVFGIFYLVLISVLIVPLQKLIDSPTAFEEFQSRNKVEFPSVTICPYALDEDDIKDFNHALIPIEKTKKEYIGRMIWSKSYHDW